MKWDLFNRKALAEARRVISEIEFAAEMPVSELTELRLQAKAARRLSKLTDATLEDLSLLPADLLHRLALTLARSVSASDLLDDKQRFLDGQIPQDQYEAKLATAVDQLQFRGDTAQKLDLVTSAVVSAAGTDAVSAFGLTLQKVLQFHTSGETRV